MMPNFPTMQFLICEAVDDRVKQIIDHEKLPPPAQHPEDVRIYDERDFTNQKIRIMRRVLPAGEITKELGAGSYGTVWEFKPDNGPVMALKISTDKPQHYIDVHKIRKTAPTQHAKHFPVIYSVWIVDRDIITLMEILEHLPDNIYRTIDTIGPRSYQSWARATGPQAREWDKQNVSEIEAQGIRKFYDALDWANLKTGLNWKDVGGDNVMIRPSDKSLVLSDIGFPS